MRTQYTHNFTMKNTLFTLSTFAATILASPLLGIGVDADVNISTQLSALVGDSSSVGKSDGNILAFALTLEQLEAAFYVEAAAKFSRSDLDSIQTGLYDNVQRLGRDEATHVTAIEETLRSMSREPPKPCQYKFPYTTAKEFVALSAILEGVGTSAYAGASGFVQSPKILSVAAAILSVEARHDAILRMASGVAPYASALDTPLDFNQAYTLAAQFIIPGSCPSSLAALNLHAFPSLSVASQGSLSANSIITLTADVTSNQQRDVKRETALERRARHVHKRQNGDVYAAFLTLNGPKIVKTTKTDAGYQAEIPEGLAGQVYMVLVNNASTVSDEATLAGPAIIEVASAAPSSGVTPSRC